MKALGGLNKRGDVRYGRRDKRSENFEPGGHEELIDGISRQFGRRGKSDGFCRVPEEAEGRVV